MDLCVGQFVDMKGMNALNRVKGVKRVSLAVFYMKKVRLKKHER